MNQTIHIFVNGAERLISVNTTLAELVARLQQEAGQENDPQALATAVNEIFIPRTSRADTLLQEGDQVFTFSPITGG
ncbi:MAG: sulfur carrier protein ThiS [Pelistega sp.]|nr:sulfur carrier protein ThiS [Pelistega sp.]